VKRRVFGFMTASALHTVLIPGLLCSARLYEAVLPAVWAHGAVTIADTRRDDSVAGMAGRLLANAPDRFALAGLSMGGYVALEVMRQAPGRVQALALISTTARADTPEQTATRHGHLAMARDGKFDALVDAFFPVMVDPGNRGSTELAAFWSDMAHNVGAAVFCTQVKAIMGRPDSGPTLPAITCPAAVIHGANDQLVPVQRAEETAAAIPHAVRTMIEGAGHMAAREKPAAVAAALDSLLQQAIR
jgi:pimeloyl-ACP methyl ester carboxylesterase